MHETLQPHSLHGTNKDQGFDYMYLGGDEPYKRQLQGYEICPPMY